jgi:hypothetical protein
MSFPGRDRCEFPSQSENVFPVVGLMQAFVSSQADRIMPSGEDRNPDELRFCYTNSALFRTRQNSHYAEHGIMATSTRDRLPALPLPPGEGWVRGHQLSTNELSAKGQPPPDLSG